MAPQRGSGALAFRRNPVRTAVTGSILFGVALGAYVVVARADPRHMWDMIDLRVYVWAGTAARRHAEVYDLRFGNLSFTYTPLALLGFELMSHAGLAVLRYAMTAASIAALLGSLWLAWGAVGPPQSTARAGLTLASGAIALWLEPIAQTLRFGQINLLLMFLVLLDLCQRDDRAWKGMGVGLAAAVKLTPSIFIGYLVLTRRFRAAAVASATLLAGIAGGFILLPAASRRFWLGGLFLDSERVGGVPYVANQSINGTLVRLFAGHGGAAPSWLVAASIVGLVGLVLAAWAGSRGLDLLGVLTCALTALLVSPISWSHHWVWIVLLFPCAADLLAGRRWTAGWLALAALTAAFAAGPVRAIWRVPSTGNLEYGWHGAQLVIGNLYVALGLVLLGLTALYLARTPAGLSSIDHRP